MQATMRPHLPGHDSEWEVNMLWMAPQGLSCHWWCREPNLLPQAVGRDSVSISLACCNGWYQPSCLWVIAEHARRHSPPVGARSPIIWGTGTAKKATGGYHCMQRAVHCNGSEKISGMLHGDPHQVLNLRAMKLESRCPWACVWSRCGSGARHGTAVTAATKAQATSWGMVRTLQPSMWQAPSHCTVLREAPQRLPVP